MGGRAGVGGAGEGVALAVNGWVRTLSGDITRASSKLIQQDNWSNGDV